MIFFFGNEFFGEKDFDFFFPQGVFFIEKIAIFKIRIRFWTYKINNHNHNGLQGSYPSKRK